MSIKRRHFVPALAAASVITIATGMFYVRGGSTPVDVGNAIERFRTSTSLAQAPAVTATPAAQTETTARERARTTSRDVVRQTEPDAIVRPQGRRPLPREGVYVYETTGGDEVDVLGGSRHTYPSETTITVRHGGCGLIERWDALEERWDERETCKTPKGDALERTTAFHEFFRRADERTYTCDYLAYPLNAQPGDLWTGRCVSGGSVVRLTGRAIGFETLAVNGTRTETLHVRVDVKLTGEQEGAGVREVWGDRATGLSIREKATTTSYSIQPVFGRTRYHESFEIRLKSLAPRT